MSIPHQKHLETITKLTGLVTISDQMFVRMYVCEATWPSLIMEHIIWVTRHATVFNNGHIN